MTDRRHDLDALVSQALPADGVAVLAVSGGLDSMVLLDLVASMCAGGSWGGDVVVATFDHASGPHSRRAAALVVRSALEYGLPVVSARAQSGLRSESAWRAARWAFLNGVAAEHRGAVLTAHTRDDQVETVLMRIMRGAGARGIAGLYAESGIRRPFVDVSRAELVGYATARRLTWREDPTNRSRRHLRNRVRLDHLPALRLVCPGIDDALLEMAREAARWREALTAIVDASLSPRVTWGDPSAPQLDVAVEALTGYSREELGVIWPELGARVGATLDRRGTRRAAEFTISSGPGRRIQLSGGWQLVRGREHFELRALEEEATDAEKNGTSPLLGTQTTWDRWTFRVTDEAETARPADPWTAALPAGGPLAIRRWRPGDRVAIRRGDRLVSTKVKGLLTGAGISGHIRGRWPVVLAGDEIIWVPGVRRSDAATERSGGPVVTYVCDYLDRRP